MSSFWGDFSFDGIRSTLFNVVMVDYGSTDILKKHGLEIDIVVDKETSGNLRPNYTIRDKSSNRIKIQLARTDNMPWGVTELLNLNGWLFKNGYKRFQVDDLMVNGSNIVYYLKAVNLVKEFNRDMMGVVSVEFESYEPYAYVIPSNNPIITSSAVVINSSNLDELYKPKMIVTSKGNDNITIYNDTISTSKGLTIKGVTNGQSVIIDNLMGTMKDGNGNNIFSKIADVNNLNFLAMKTGNNTIRVLGNAQVELICEFPIII